MVEDPFWGIDSLTQDVTNFDVHAGDPSLCGGACKCLFVCGEREREREREREQERCVLKLNQNKTI